MVWFHSNPKATDPRIMLVELNEKDIKSMDWPLRDTKLAELFEKIESGGPAVVGIDLYRDLPEPRDGSGTPILNQTWIKYPNIVPIFLFDSDDKGQPFIDVPPPQVLASGPNADPTRLAFNNLPDLKIIRRAWLFEGDWTSFPCALAQYYLAGKNIQASMEGTSFRLGKTVYRQLQGNDGGYVNAPAGGYQFMLDYRGPEDFDTRSVSDVLALKDASIFKDKIVLIGIDADSSNDTFTTPLADGENAFSWILGRDPKKDIIERKAGVLLHAEIVNQILRAALDGDKPTIGMGQTAEWLWILLWCVVGVITGFFVRSHILFGITVALGIVAIALCGWFFFINGYWIIGFTPSVVFLAAAMLVKAYAATHEEEQRQNLMKLFSQHVSPEIAQEMWEQRETFLQGGRPAAQKIVVTVLFTDLKNYSTISEKMTPAELIAWVNECQSALAQHVGKNGGIVNCYMGDGMMAVFGIPVPRTTEEAMARDAINAVTCAMSMSGEIHAMNLRWKAEGKPLAGLRVGIYTGEAMAGVLGSDDHLAYSVIGDTVNTASRLESVDKEGVMTSASDECRILIGARTYRYIKDKFRAQQVGTVNLKGKAETTEVYKVFVDSAE
jgi:adenylate cyclase